MRPFLLGRASLVCIALTVTILAVGITNRPHSAMAMPAERSSTPPPFAGASLLPVDTSSTPSPTALIPESGAQLTAAVWQMAIGQAVVDAGETKLGTPYVYAAGGPYAFDCSGFTRWVWMQLGVKLPHNSGAQWAMVERLPLDQLAPGDLVFNWGFGGGEPDHVGIYVGDGIMIHSPNSSGSVRYDPITWWTGATTAAGRVR